MSATRVLNLSRLVKNASFRSSVRWNQHLASAKYAQILLNLPETKISELDNGFKIVTEATDAPTATVGVWIDAGSRYENKANNGAAKFLEHLAFKAPTLKSRQELDKEIQNLGAQFDSYTQREETAFYAKCLAADAPKVVEILGDATTNAEFSDELVEEQRKVILMELEETETDMRQVTFDYLHLTAYQGTPLEKSVYGPSENIKRFTKEDITKYARNSFIAPRMALCATGNVNHDELVKAAEKSFGSVPITYTDVIPILRRCRFTGSDVRVREDWFPLAHVAIAVDAAGLDSPDTYPLMLAKSHVGSWGKTLASSADTCNTLTRNVYKEKGCHSFDSFYTMYRDGGLWGCYFVVDKMVIDDFIFNLQNEWMKLCINITEPELTLAKNKLRNDILFALDDPVNHCATMGRQILLLGKRIDIDEVEEAIESVTLNKFRDTCVKYIYDRCPVVAGLGPIEGLTDYTRIRSAMYTLRY